MRESDEYDLIKSKNSYREDINLSDEDKEEE